MMKLGASLLCLAVTAIVHAQTSEPAIKGHKLGESLEQFMAESTEVTRRQMSRCISANSVDLPGFTDYHCESFLNVRKSVARTGNFHCEDPVFNSEFSTDVCRDFRGDVWFENNKLVKIHLEIISGDWTSALSDVSAKFGKPDEIHVDSMQNAYGAKFDLQTATWTRPEYLVVAMEKVNLPYNLKRFVEVYLTDHAYFREQKAASHRGNSLD